MINIGGQFTVKTQRYKAMWNINKEVQWWNQKQWNDSEKWWKSRAIFWFSETDSENWEEIMRYGNPRKKH